MSLLESKLQKHLTGKFGDKYIMPSFDVLMQKRSKEHLPVLSLEFSCKSEMLAVSYAGVLVNNKAASSTNVMQQT